VRPVNLIPLDQRRGTARTPGASKAPIRVYILLGALGAALFCVLALVLTSNKINSRTEELAEVKGQEQGVKQVADALRPYGQFAALEQAREAQISALASSRFDWERSLRQLSRAIPSNVWVVKLAATVSPAVEVEGGGGGGDTSSLREETEAPAFALTGCTFSHHAVARMMVRMRNLDEVTRVRLAKSARQDTAGAATPAPEASSDQQSAQPEGDAQDCTGSSRVTKFDMLVEFGGGTAAGAAAAAAGGVGSSAAAPLAKAEAAGQQAAAASSAAQGQAVSSTGGGQ
jgi:Tfp pilus assembly protein PilN